MRQQKPLNVENKIKMQFLTSSHLFSDKIYCLFCISAGFVFTILLKIRGAIISKKEALATQMNRLADG